MSEDAATTSSERFGDGMGLSLGEGFVRHNSFDAKRRRLWVHGPKPEFWDDEDVYDQWYMSARTIALVRPGLDVIILPGGNEQLRDFAQFCARILGLQAWQILWTSGASYLLDDDITREFLPRLRELLGGGEQWEIVPYAVTEPFMRWAGELPRVPVFGDDADFVARFSNKACLCPDVPGSRNRRTLPLLPDRIAGLRTARGYAAYDYADLRRAIDLLASQGIDYFAIKPVVGTTGEGILFVPADSQHIATYDFPMGPVLVEERLKIDCAAGGGQIAPSVQYFGTELFPAVTDQICYGAVYYGNVFPSVAPAAFQQEMREMAQALIDHLHPQGPGGFDFLSVGGRPVLSDPNVGRFTAAFPARIFSELYAPRSPFVCWKVRAFDTVFDFWAALQSKGAAFKDGRGVFPLCYLPGMWSMLGAFADTPEEVKRLRAIADACI